SPPTPTPGACGPSSTTRSRAPYSTSVCAAHPGGWPSCTTTHSTSTRSWSGSEEAEMKGVVIFGTGDIARLAHHYFTKDSPHQVAAFTVDRAFQKGDRFLDKPVVPFEE